MRGLELAKAIGRRIQRTRTFRGLSLRELEEKCSLILTMRGIDAESLDSKGFTWVSLGEMERGKRIVLLDKLEIVAAALEVPVTKLLPPDWVKDSETLTIKGAVLREMLSRMPQKEQDKWAERFIKLYEEYKS